ncbi:sulfotransferase domain-containing protein [Oscillatoria salina]|uniref:sulfotransferase domain-containing protein n=1 Tax=Oscillatoria salina TaxID=331517 RepID=UPI001CCDE5B2|nr:sulfotransferase domain-containing protein [Oscillatoria salina]MBZ8181850.1 sulfotransferase domain-containing protein [Oscillatoria salina IIICB1]
MNLPQFIVLGGHKCGTSSLHSYLDQHPEIYLPAIKGIDFFSREGNPGQRITTIEEYQALYQDKSQEQIAGEVSSVYLNSPKACRTIKKYVPDAKLIVVLRNPIDRAFSHFNVLKETKKRERDFQEIFTEKKVKKNGFYAAPLKMYLGEFGREQFKFFLFDSLTKNQQEFFADFFEFIGVDASFMPDTSLILRKGGKIKYNKIERVFQQNNSLKKILKFVVKPFTTPKQRLDLSVKMQNAFTKRIQMPSDIRKQLTELYREDILQVQDLLEIDLSHWLKASSK